MSEHMCHERSNCYRSTGVEATSQTVAIPYEGAAKDTGNGLTAGPLCAEFPERTGAGRLETGSAT